MDWLNSLLSLAALAIKLLNETIDFISKAQGFVREHGPKGRRR